MVMVEVSRFRLRRDVMFFFLFVISLSLAWMFRPRMIWELNSLSPITRVGWMSMTLNFTSPFMIIDYHHILNLIIRSSHTSHHIQHHISFDCTRLQHTPGLNPIIKPPSPSPSPPITPQQTPLRTPTLARPLPRLRRVPRPTRAGPVRPRSMTISVVWRVGRSISVSRARPFSSVWKPSLRSGNGKLKMKLTIRLLGLCD